MIWNNSCWWCNTYNWSRENEAGLYAVSGKNTTCFVQELVKIVTIPLYSTQYNNYSRITSLA